MKQYECDLCGYVYDEAAGDPDNGIAPGTKWEDLPADWAAWLESKVKLLRDAEIKLNSAFKALED